MKVTLQDIHKHFGRVHANNAVSIDVPAGTILGILGENGAGKSTLMKILSGYIRPDSGTVSLDGTPAALRSPADAIAHGVGMLHQDPLDFPPMKVIENFIAAGRDGLLLGRRAARGELERLARHFGFNLDPNARVSDLTVGERQQLEILRLLWLGARVLILDEPTTGISLPQKEKLFATLKQLASEGVSILFVSHKLEDVELLCSRIVVLRRGEVVGWCDPPYRTKTLVEMMFGKEVGAAGKTAGAYGRTLMQLRGVSVRTGALHLRDVDLDVRAGEVIGLAGMEGSGQAAFLAACAGLLRTSSGTISVGDRVVGGRSHHTFRRHGVSYLPAARLERGLIAGLTLAEHFVLAEGHTGLFMDRRRTAELARERVAAYAIKGTPTSLVESLSGGNQQRALLALLRQKLNVILLEHPTRGLDIESTIYVWGRLKERCGQGTAIIFISADLDEILTYSDRVMVFFAGRVSAPLLTESVTVDELGHLIGGKGWDDLTVEYAGA